jgi:hypothetical protein
MHHVFTNLFQNCFWLPTKQLFSKLPLLLVGKVTSLTKASPFQRKMVSKLPQRSSFQKKTIIIPSSTLLDFKTYLQNSLKTSLLFENCYNFTFKKSFAFNKQNDFKPSVGSVFLKAFHFNLGARCLSKK